MSLITCSDCGSEVSTSATACPRCGRPFKQRSQEGLFLQSLNAGCFLMLSVTVLIIVLVVIGMLARNC